jgi:hypothetical protein
MRSYSFAENGSLHLDFEEDFISTPSDVLFVDGRVYLLFGDKIEVMNRMATGLSAVATVPLNYNAGGGVLHHSENKIYVGHRRGVSVYSIDQESGNHYNLTVNSTGVTGAFVTVSPPDLNGKTWGTTPATFLYENSTSVSVQTAPDHDGASFYSWTGNVMSQNGLMADVLMEGERTITASYQVAVLPDFIVESIELDPPAPVVNHSVTATVVVKNIGTVTGNAGWLDLWHHKPNAANAGEEGDAYVNVGELSPGERKEFTHIFQPQIEGPHVFRAFVDSFGATNEANEENNQLTLIYEVSAFPSYVDQQYYLDGIPSWTGESLVHVNAKAAWEITKGDPAIGIAIIDVDFWPGHPDLPETYGGWDFLENSPIEISAYDQSDRNNHGTLIAGIISAQHNGFGIKGIAPDCSINYYRTGPGFDEEINVVTAVQKAIEHNNRVISISITPTGLLAQTNKQELWDVVQAAVDEGRTIVIGSASTPNNQTVNRELLDSTDFISHIPGVIVVGGVGMHGQHHQSGGGKGGNAISSNSVDVSAPAQEIVSTRLPLPDNQQSPYDQVDGTSFGLPMVSAIVGLMYSVNPALTPVEVEAILRETANPDMLPDFDGAASGHDPRFGYGVVDAAAAVRQAEKMRPQQRDNYGEIRMTGSGRFQSEFFGLLEFADNGADHRNAFSYSLQSPLVDQAGGIFSPLYGRLTPNPWDVPQWVVSEFFGLVHFGADADQYAGWVSSERFGWMRFVDAGGGNRYLWVQRLQTWMAVNPDGSFHSFDFGWLVPEPGSFTRYNSRIGILIDDEHNPEGWLRSDRFGFVWFARDGTGVWFWSSSRNEWIGITPQGGLWSTVEGRFLP